MVKIAIAMGLAIIAAATGDILMSKGMKEIGRVSVHHLSDIPPLAKRVFTCRYVLTGVAAMAIYFTSFVTSLAWADVSVVVPLTALSYVITTTYSAFVVREHVSLTRWIGVAVLSVGVALVGISS